MSQRPRQIRMLYSSATQSAPETTWRPAADIYRTRDGWLLKFELAGVSIDDISVRAEGSAVTVSGVRRDQAVAEKCCQYSMEILYSRFERTIHLPCDIQAASLAVDYQNGILLVSVVSK